MASEASSGPNVPAESEEDKGTWPVVGSRMHPDNVRLVDLARVLDKKKHRGELVEEAVLEKTKEILDRHGQPCEFVRSE